MVFLISLSFKHLVKRRLIRERIDHAAPRNEGQEECGTYCTNHHFATLTLRSSDSPTQPTQGSAARCDRRTTRNPSSTPTPVVWPRLSVPYQSQVATRSAWPLLLSDRHHHNSNHRISRRRVSTTAPSRPPPLVAPPTEPHNPFDSHSGTLSTALRASHGHVSANRTNTARPPFSPSPRQVPRHPSCPVPSQRIAAQRAPVPPDRAIPQAPPTSSPHRALGDRGIIGSHGELPTQEITDMWPDKRPQRLRRDTHSLILRLDTPANNVFLNVSTRTDHQARFPTGRYSNTRCASVRWP